MIIRRATSSDIEALSALYVAFFREDGIADPVHLVLAALHNIKCTGRVWRPNSFMAEQAQVNTGTTVGHRSPCQSPHVTYGQPVVCISTNHAHTTNEG